MAFEAGEWQTARERCSAAADPPGGTLYIFRQLVRPSWRSASRRRGRGRACLDAARRSCGARRATMDRAVRRAARGAATSPPRPRWRAGGGRGGAGPARVCTDDVMRIARVSCIGLRVEADRRPARPGPARERRPSATRSRAGAAARTRLAAAAQDGGPVEHARLAQGSGRAGPRPRPRRPAREWAGRRCLGDARAPLSGGGGPVARGRGGGGAPTARRRERGGGGGAGGAERWARSGWPWEVDALRPPGARRGSRA